MSTISYIKDEFNELKKMPFFWGRLVCFSILFALDELTVTYFESPYLFYFIAALAVFFVPSVVMQALALDKAGAKLKMSAPLLLWLILGGIATVNEVTYGLLNGVTPIYLASVFCFFIPVLAYCGKEKGFYKLFLLSLAGPILFNFIAGLVLFPLVSNIYALGVVGFVPVLLSAAQVLKEKKRFFGVFACALCVALSVALLYVSMGRTGFLASLLSIPVFILIVALVKRAEKKNVVYRETPLTITSLALVCAFFTLIVALIVGVIIAPPSLPAPDAFKVPDNMLDKFIQSLQTKNLFSGRMSVWRYTFENISIIGNGPFFYMGDNAFWHAHNSFIAVLAHYGIVPFVLYCIFCVWIFSISIKYSFRGTFMRFLPFITIFTYFASGVMEDLACIVVPRMFSVLFYFVCALLINEYPKAKEKQKNLM